MKETTSFADAHTIIRDALMSIPGPKKTNGDEISIQCPYHDDATPSLGVYMGDGHDMHIGTFNCFGCPAKGKWNTLAEKLNLPKIKGWQESFVGTMDSKILGEGLDELLEENSFSTKKLLKSVGTAEAFEWPKKKEWRGYSGKLILKLGGMQFVDPRSDELMLLFPVVINNKFHGGVKAHLVKPPKGLSYVNTPGKWTNKYGLFGYEYAKHLVEKHGFTFIIVVEGPRDCLRMLQAGIPCVAILGSKSFSSTKLTKIMSMFAVLDVVYVLPDNDSAGTEMYKKVKLIAGGSLTVKHIKLPREKDKKGKLIKMDPDDMPKSILKNIINNLREKHGKKMKKVKRKYY